MPVSVKMTVTKSIPRLGLSPAAFRRAAGRSLRRLGTQTIGYCQQELEDVRYTGELAGSFVARVSDAKLEVYPTAKHAAYHRLGTRPHWAPIGPLKAWARAKLGSEEAAYPVQRSIAKHGTSMYQYYRRGTKGNPWPNRVVERGDFQGAVRQAAGEIGRQVMIEAERRSR